MRLTTLAVGFCSFLAVCSADTGLITTVAGNGTPGSGGVGGPATSANLYYPSCLARDSNGNLYISDSGNGYVYRVDASTGILTIATGPGTADVFYQGNAVVLLTYCMALDAAGNIYTTGGSSNRIYRMDAVTGLTTTFAGTGVLQSNGDGGPAASAGVYVPQHLAFDSHGNLFVVEFDHKVRRIDGVTGIITTVAGTGIAGFSGDGGSATAAQLNYPVAVNVDASGNLFISDYYNFRVRRVDASTGIVTTVAGTGVDGQFNGGIFNGDNIPATSANISPFGIAVDSGGNLFIGSRDRIRRVDAATGIITTVAGTGFYGSTSDGIQATSAKLNVAVFPLLLPNGNLLISEALHAPKVRQIAYPGPLALTATAVSSGTWTVGQPITLTATVAPLGAPGSPTGGVDFYDVNGSSYQPLNYPQVSVVNGTATYTVPSLSQGSHNIEAFYHGDNAFGASVSGRLTKTVQGAAVTIGIQANPSPSLVGQNVTFTITVNPVGGGSAPSGSLMLQLDGGWQWYGTVAAPTIFNVNKLTDAGIHTIAVSYGGDSSYAPATATTTQQVQNATTTSVATQPSAPLSGQSVTITATVTPSNATGTVVFSNEGGSLGSATLSGGVASISTATLPAGAHSIYAHYAGDTSNRSSDGSASLTIFQATTTALTSSNTQQQYQSTVTFTAPVTPAAATGTVQFLDGATVLGSATVNSGVAILNYSSLAIGTHPIQAVYSGDTAYAGSSSAAVNQVIIKATAPVALTLMPNPSTIGQTVYMSAYPSGTGTVQFLDGTTVLTTVTVANLHADFTVSNLVAGTHAIQAVYSGDSNYNGASSTVINQVVNKTATTTTLGVSPNPSTVGQSVTLTATFSPVAATGTVQFLDGTTVLGTVTASAGSAALSLTSLSAATHAIQAVYSGDASYAGSSSSAVNQVVNLASTTTTLAAAPNPSAFGQSVTLTATVTPAAATGTVQFLDGSTVLGTATVSTGAAGLSLSNLTAGTHSIQAVYAGDSSYAGSSSAAVNQVVNKAASTVTLASAPNPSAFGQSVTLTATLTPAAATGTVQFLDGTTALGTAAVSAGSAAFSVSSIGVGTHSLEAVYSGDASFSGGTSAAVNQIVNKANATVALAASPNPSTLNQSVSLTATLTPAAATGTVQFLDGATVLGTATVNAGSAVFNVTSLAVGAHSLQAVYSGDSSYTGGTSSTVNQTVNKASSTVALGSSPNPSAFGLSVTLGATLTPAAATGTVQFLDGSTVLGTATVNSGAAALSIGNLAAGTHAIQAVYSGDASFAGSSSSVVSQVVNRAGTAATLASSPNPSSVGQSVTLTANVTPAAATGTVQFLDGSTVLGSASVNAGVAVLGIASLAAGTHAMQAVYSGDGSYAASSSAAVNQAVNKLSSTAALSLSANPTVYGSNVVYTVTVTPAAATGNVQVTDNGALFAIYPLSGGKATFNAANGAGTQTLQAVYVGDATYSGSTSATVTQTVTKAPTSVVLTPSPNPSVHGQSVTLTAAVTSSLASGTVSFFNGGALLATVSISGGIATYATAALSTGSHSLTATYNGDLNYQSSNSPSANQNVNKASSSTAITSSANPAVRNTTVVFTATVTAPGATGQVAFKDGSSTLSTVTLVSGKATFSTSSLSVKTHSITAQYLGDGNYNTSASPVLSETITH